MTRAAAYRMSRVTGINILARWLLERRLLILCYHGVCDTAPDVPDIDGLHVPRSLFEAQLEALLECYTPVGLSTVLACLQLGPESLPARALLLTFDDGYVNVARNALPALRRRGVPCAWFVVPGVVDEGGWLWPCTLEWQHGRSPGFRRLRAELKAAAAPSRRERLGHLLRPQERPAQCDYTLATWDDLAREVRRGGVEVGSHGLTHELLSTCDRDETVARELHLSAELIRDRLGVAVFALAYAGGAVSPGVIEAARGAGYRLGFTTEPRHVRSGDDMLALPRILVGRSDDPVTLMARTAGWLDWVRGWLSIGRA
jgi:peptidoglycan/xylan/chitin deacetylase (PgdA/CDA1 family)